MPTPGTGPYNYPQITINAPISSPPQVLTNVASLLQANIVGVSVFKNGVQLTVTTDYTLSGDLVTFTVAPAPTDVLTANVYAIGVVLGGPTTTQALAPWTIPLIPYAGSSTVFSITTGPSITGPTDGVNNLFTYQIGFHRVQVYRNGVAQTIGQDFSNGMTAIVFFPASIPQSGDIVTVFGWA